MKNFKSLLLSVILSVIFIGCDSDNDPTNNVCENNYVSTIITDAFSVANGYNDLAEYMDLETHEYDLKILADGEICSVGYQNPSAYTGGYTMEIINNTSSVSYVGTHTFLQSQLDYQTIPTPVLVSSGDIITVRRTILPGYSSLNETVGRVLRKSDFTNVPYPIIQGNIEFISSNFYGSGGPVPNHAQPYIALGFKVN